jgi:phosphatidate cytidylyltransferase
VTDEREREEGRPEDLFEDLDTFFAPIEDLDAEAEAAATEARRGSEADGEEQEDVPGADERPPTEAAEASELTKPPDEDLEAAGRPGPVEPGEPAGAPGLAPSAGERVLEPSGPEDEMPGAMGSGEALDEETDWFGESAGPAPEAEGELTGEEWDRFRDALRSVELEEEEATPPIPRAADPFGAVAPSTEEPRTAEPADATGRLPAVEAEDEGELAGEPIGPEEAWLAEEPEARAGEEPEEEGVVSLDDLEAVPPVYRDLPGPDEEAEGVGAGTGEPGAGAAVEERPTPEALEAAADHFAESMRQSPEDVEEDLLADLDRAEEEPSVIRVGGEPEGEAEPIEPAGVVPGLEAEPAGVGAPGAGEAEDLAALGAPGTEPEGPRRVRVGAADDLAAAGPSWQEPTSEAVDLDATVPVAGRNIPAAFITGLVLAVLGIGSLALGRAAFAFFAGAIVLLAQGELYASMVRARLQPATAIGLVFGGLTLAAAYLQGEAAMLAMVALSVAFTFLWYMATPARARRNVVVSMGATILGIVYAPLFAGYVLVVLALPFEGRALVIAIVGLAFLFDVVAYAAGAGFGGSVFRRALAATISPRKSWEGVLLASVVVLAVSLLLVDSSLETIASSAEAIGLGLVVAIAATFGDLSESALKRDMGIKDMGTILPGHGGVLDRIDSVLFVAPAAFFFLRLFVF